MRIKAFLFAVCVTSLIPASAVRAQSGIERDVRTLDLEGATQSLSRFDLEPKWFWFEDSDVQFGFGFRASSYTTEQLNFPLALFATQLPNDDDFFYVTTGVGYDCQVSEVTSLQASVNLGIAAFENDNAAFVLEPVAGIAFRPWKWLRIGVNGSYLSLAEGLPGAWTAAANLQFKTFSLSWPE